MCDVSSVEALRFIFVELSSAAEDNFPSTDDTIAASGIAAVVSEARGPVHRRTCCASGCQVLRMTMPNSFEASVDMAQSLSNTKDWI